MSGRFEIFLRQDTAKEKFTLNVLGLGHGDSIFDRHVTDLSFGDLFDLQEEVAKAIREQSIRLTLQVAKATL